MSTVKVRRYSYNPNSVVEVELTKDDRLILPQWDVSLDGKIIGRVGSYEGSIDRRIPNKGRFLLSPGKRRTLWWTRGPDAGARETHGHGSRAEAIRWLLP